MKRLEKFILAVVKELHLREEGNQVVHDEKATVLLVDHIPELGVLVFTDVVLEKSQDAGQLLSFNTTFL